MDSGTETTNDPKGAAQTQEAPVFDKPGALPAAPGPPASPLSRRSGRFENRLPEIVAVALALVYWLALSPVLRSAGPDEEFLGFVHIDQPVYYASAREHFENGNGLFYASPYSIRPDSPRIYSHLVFLVFGWLWRYGGMSFGQIDHLLRLIFGVLSLVLLVRLFRRSLPPGRLTALASIAVVSCGGLAWLFASLNLAIGYLSNLGAAHSHSLGLWLSLFPGFFADAETGYAEWHLNVLRNLTYTPEAVYHTMVFACALCLLARRLAWAVAFVFLTWWSHPYTGLELGMIVAAYLALEWLFARQRRWLAAFAACMAVNALFILYNGWWLRRFDEHASIYAQVLESSNIMLWSMYLPAYGLFALLPLFYFATKDFRASLRSSPAVRLFFAWLVCVFFLTMHDRFLFFMTPVLPMHFTHGYLYVPLVFFCALGLHRLTQLDRCTARKAFVLLSVVAVAHLPDSFLGLYCQASALGRTFPYKENKKVCEFLRKLDEIPETMSLHAICLRSEYKHLDYLIPVMTRHRGLLSHHLAVPFPKQNRQLAAELRETLSPELMSRLHLTGLVVDRDTLARLEPEISAGRMRVALEHDGVYVVKIEPAAS